jgi:superfamily II DNA or RNA helicase
VSNNLLIPKGAINVEAVKQALTFVIGEEELIDTETNEVIGTRAKKYELWDETRTHVIAPRAFLAPDQMRDLGIDWFEDRHVSLTVSFPNEGIKFRNKVQEEAFFAMHRSDGGILNLACGKGKTVLALKEAAVLQVPTLIVVNTTALLEQWKAEIIKHLGVSDDGVGVIQGDRCEWEGFPISIAMVHTLANRRQEWTMEFRTQWGLIVFDETHHMSAPHFVRAADLFFGKRIGLTATATRTDRLEAIYQYHIGRIVYSDLEQDLVPNTVFHVLDWELEEKQASKIRDKAGDVNLSKVRTFLATLDWRNRLIIDQLVEDIEDGRTILVLSHSVPGVKELFDIYAHRVDGPRADEAGYIVGEVDQAERIPILKHSNPVFGTFQLSREGLDKPSLDTLYITTPFANSNDLQQAWGRIQRMHDGKREPLIRVFEDTAISVCVRSCRSLRKYLKALKYPVDRKKERLDVRSETNRGGLTKQGTVRRKLRGQPDGAGPVSGGDTDGRVAIHQREASRAGGPRALHGDGAHRSGNGAAQGTPCAPRKLVRH